MKLLAVTTLKGKSPAVSRSGKGRTILTKLSGVVAAGTVFSHLPNCSIDFTVSTMPTASGIAIMMRRVNDTNNWRVRVVNDGNLQLYEMIGGGDNLRVQAGAGTVVNGNTIKTVFSGLDIKIFVNGALKITYSNAINFSTATTGKLNTLGTGGQVQNIVVYSAP